MFLMRDVDQNVGRMFEKDYKRLAIMVVVMIRRMVIGKKVG